MSGRDPIDLLARRLPKTPRAALSVLTSDDRPGAAFEDAWRANLKRRVIVVIGVLTLWAVAVEARFVNLQVVQHKFLLEQAELRQNRTLKEHAKRGEIVDRNGQVLAFSVDADTVIAVPSAIADAEATVTALCRAFGDCTAAERKDLTERLSSTKAFAYVRRQIAPDAAGRVAKLKLAGIGLLPETKRFYPKRELASHVLGFVNLDNIGLGGIEAAFNSKITGIDGQSLVQIDARGRTVQSLVEQPSQPGETIELTIDQYVQHIAERELEAGVKKFNAKGGTAIVLDPANGEILAAASFPNFNPNFPQDVTSEDARLNRAVQAVYEPGSTFKIVTASAAFENGLFKIDDIVDCNPGVITIPGRKPITEAKGHNYGAISFEDVIVHSSNVGAIKIGLRVGGERLEDYARRFGFGQKVNKELNGESRGYVAPLRDLNESSLASMSMGYEVNVTPMQMVAAVGAVANGGTLYQPHLVRAKIANGERAANAPKVLSQAIKPETAATLTEIMEQVVARGTGGLAKVDGYQVAGKTGTAAKIVNGHYSMTDYNVSFVGFVPSRHPRLAIIVVIDTPRNGNPYGGSVSAPIWHEIAEASLRQLGVPRSINPVPPVLITAPAVAINQPLVNMPIAPVVTETSGENLVPNLQGLSARDALRAAGRAGLTARVAGEGVVVSQAPLAGAPLERGGVITVQLKRIGAPK